MAALAGQPVEPEPASSFDGGARDKPTPSPSEHALATILATGEGTPGR
jgi:hypothetical protein